MKSMFPDIFQGRTQISIQIAAMLIHSPVGQVTAHKATQAYRSILFRDLDKIWILSQVPALTHPMRLPRLPNIFHTVNSLRSSRAIRQKC